MNNLQSESLAEIGRALAAAQASMGVAIKDSRGQIGQNRNYKYADLASVMNAAHDALEANHLSVIQRPMPSDVGVCIQTMILHESGEWISDGGLHLPLQKIDPQGAGSSITYARRYGLAAMLGIVQDDDDAASAVSHQESHAAKKAPTPAPAAPKPAPAKTAAEQLADMFDAAPAAPPASAVGGDTGANADAYTFKFGKNKGKALTEVESSYLDWLLKQPPREGYEDEHAAQHAMFRRELHRRGAAG
jgi:hypothetical protein